MKYFENNQAKSNEKPQPFWLQTFNTGRIEKIQSLPQNQYQWPENNRNVTHFPRTFLLWVVGSNGPLMATIVCQKH